MKTSNALNALAIALCLIFPAILSAQSMESVAARVLSVNGSVQDQNGNAIAPNSELAQGTVVRTGVASSALIILANGSAVNVDANTELVLERMEQAPYNASLGSFQQLRSDPSRSVMHLGINRGTVSGKALNLRRDSEFEVRTPVGVAGIRGTYFSVSVEPLGRGLFRITINNVDGTIEIASFVLAINNQQLRQRIGQGQTLIINTNGDGEVVEQNLEDLTPGVGRALIRALLTPVLPNLPEPDFGEGVTDEFPIIVFPEDDVDPDVADPSDDVRNF